MTGKLFNLISAAFLIITLVSLPLQSAESDAVSVEVHDEHAGEAPDIHAGETAGSHAGEAPAAHAGEEPDAHAGEAPDAHTGEAPGAHAGGAAGIKLTEKEMADNGILMAVAGSGSLSSEVALPGEIDFNRENFALVVPKVSGIVSEVRKKAGETVITGEVLAIMESRELTEASARYFAACEKIEIEKICFEREQELWKKKITSAEEFLDAKQKLAEATLEKKFAEQNLIAMGLSELEISRVHKHDGPLLTKYELKSTISGVIIDRQIVLGEKLDDSAKPFTIADLSSVTVKFNVYLDNLSLVREGMDVDVKKDKNRAGIFSRINYLSRFIDSSTRTAAARAVLDNSDGSWRPGEFVTVVISGDELKIPVLVSKDAVQSIETEKVVFVDSGKGFVTRPVKLGRSNASHIEIISGLNPGESYVAKGAFELKAKIVSSGMDSHAGHGH
ncbi:MAG: efflux RND transporter periplasmic adaptor subunit [Candidatus Wallbacteria bacterium]|nr:efflux RND transporter periplasmic adaptor subunit [Candidatus Wallbacteria bacterium]